MQFGPHAKWLAETALQAGDPVPDDAKPPALPDECKLAYTAFPELTTTRAIGMASGPIPWTAINDYALRYRIRGQLFDEFVLFVRVIDDAFLASNKPTEQT